jgi:hypothetical protein
MRSKPPKRPTIPPRREPALCHQCGETVAVDIVGRFVVHGDCEGSMTAVRPRGPNPYR